MTNPLSDEEARMAYFEKDENFRWIANMFAPVCPTRLSKPVEEHVQRAVYAFAEFAEIAHGSIDPEWILDKENRLLLGQSGFPLEKYPTLAGQAKDEREHTGKLLEDIRLVSVFHGEKGPLQGYCALRMTPKTPAYDAGANPVKIRPQLILAFSGTSNLRLAMYDMQTSRTAYRTEFEPRDREWLVHTGFQTVYQGIRREAFWAVNQALDVLKQDNITAFDVVITAHSLGTAVSYLTLLDILRADPYKHPSVPKIPDSSNITMALFGAPRVGNKPFVEYFRKLVEARRVRTGRKEAVTEWSVIGHLDGVPALPPTYFGYEHFSKAPFYSYGGLLFSIPSECSEFTRFVVDYPKEKVKYLRGGHNYYGGRDMERLQRRIKAIRLDLLPKEQRSTIIYRNMSRKRTATTSDLTHPTQSMHSSPSRGWSVPTSLRSAQNQSYAPFFNTNISEEPEPMTPVETVRSASSPHAEIPEWARRYLEREEAEETTWKKKLAEEKKGPVKGLWSRFF